LQIPIFNHNQGNISAAHADIERAEQEKKRIALTLRERAAAVVDQYANARLMAVEYRDEILPRAKKAYGLMVEKYGLMLASYPRVLESQKKLYELHAEYIMALEGVWTNGIALQGGTRYDIKLEYLQNSGKAQAHRFLLYGRGMDSPGDIMRSGTGTLVGRRINLKNT